MIELCINCICEQQGMICFDGWIGGDKAEKEMMGYANQRNSMYQGKQSQVSMTTLKMRVKVAQSCLSLRTLAGL